MNGHRSSKVGAQKCSAGCEKRCPASLANSEPTANIESDNLVGIWENAKVDTDKQKHECWNPVAVGNILGESATPIVAANVPISDNGASATKLPPLRANSKSPKSVGPAKVLASVLPNQLMEKDMPPGNTPRDHPPNVANPFMMNDTPPCAGNNFWPTNLVQLAKELGNLPSSKPSTPEIKFSLDQESAQKNLCVLSKYGFNLKAALKAHKDSPLIY